jgi:putative hemolysin
VQFDYIPDELKLLPQWCVWRTKDSPTSPVTNRRKDWQNNLGTFEQAVTYCEQKKGYKLGFVFSADSDVFGIDLDSCRDPETGKIEPWAKEIIDYFSTYSEVSASGTGIKLIGVGNAEHRIVRLPDQPKHGDHEPHFEIFSDSKYFALTGDVIEHFEELSDECQDGLNWLAETYSDEPRRPVSEPTAKKKLVVQESGNGDLSAKVEEYNRENSILNLLLAAGWSIDSEGRPVRPGKNPADGHSGSIEFGDNGIQRLVVWSSNAAPFTASAAGKSATTYDPWSVNVLLNHNGDFKKAFAAELKNGSPKPAPAPVTVQESELDFSELRDFEPFPIECLPPLARQFVEEGSKAIDCDPCFVALPLLSVIGTAIGNAAWIAATPTFVQPPILWTCIVGKSGTAKSPAIALAESLLARFELDFQREHDREREEYVQAKVDYQNKLKRKKPGEFVTPPERPPERRIMTTNATLEKLALMMADNPKGIVYLSEELAGWVSMFTRYTAAGTSDLNTWLSIYDGKAINQDRKTTDSVFVRRSFVSVTGGLQPGRLFSVFDKAAEISGLTARILFAYPPLRVRSLSGTVQSVPCSDDVSQRLGRLIRIETGAELDRFEWEPVKIGLTDQSFEIYKEFFDSLNREVALEEDAISAAVQKIVGAALRIALVFHAFDDPAAIEDARPVEGGTMANAIRVAHWFKNEAYRLYAIANPEFGSEVAEVVMNILSVNGPCTVRKMRDHSRKIKKETSDDVEKVCRQLVADGRVNSRLPDGGRSPEFFIPVPNEQPTELFFDV